MNFPGFIIRAEYLPVNPKRIKRTKDKTRRTTGRNGGRPLGAVIGELNPLPRGWMNYYCIANIRGLTERLMQWLRRRLCMIKIKHRKTHKETRKKGIEGTEGKTDVCRWKNPETHIIHILLPNKFFEDLGPIDMHKYEAGVLSNHYRFD
jgi:RNA-directed DNA polymerase